MPTRKERLDIMLHKRRQTNERRFLRDRAGGTPSAAGPAPRMRPLEVTSAANRVARTLGAPSGDEVAAAHVRPRATIAALVGNATGEDWAAFVADRISVWAEGYWGETGAGSRSPWCGLSPYAAWRGEAELDRTPEILGVRGFRGIARTLPRDANGLLLRVAHDLELNGEVFETYLRRLLATIVEWARQARGDGRHGVSVGSADTAVRETLAIRAAWDLALHDAFGTKHRGVVATLRQRLAAPMHVDTGTLCRRA